MTIYGVGVDLPRMAALINRQRTDKVALRILSPAKQAVFGRGSTTRFLGAVCACLSLKRLNGHSWAVKEAAYKALYPLRPTWKELTFTTFDPQTGSKPTLVFHPSSGEHYTSLSATTGSISLHTSSPRTPSDCSCTVLVSLYHRFLGPPVWPPRLHSPSGFVGFVCKQGSVWTQMF